MYHSNAVREESHPDRPPLSVCLVYINCFYVPLRACHLYHASLLEQLLPSTTPKIAVRDSHLSRFARGSYGWARAGFGLVLQTSNHLGMDLFPATLALRFHK